MKNLMTLTIITLRLLTPLRSLKNLRAFTGQLDSNSISDVAERGKGIKQGLPRRDAFGTVSVQSLKSRLGCIERY